MQDFFEIAEARGFTSTYYPHSVKGQNIMRFMIKCFKWSSISLITNLTIKICMFVAKATKADFSQLQTSGRSWFDFSKMQPNLDAIQKDMTIDNIKFLLVNLGSVLVSLIDMLTFSIFLILLLLVVFTIPAWMFIAIKRNQNYERNCFRNDIVASNLKSTLIRKMRLNRRIRNLEKRIAKSRESESGSDSLDKMETDLSALQAIRAMRVHVNTRQSLNDSHIETQYRLEFMTEDIYDAYEKMMQELKKIDSIADIAVKGKVSFGQVSESKDRSTLTVKAVQIEKDKYDYSDWVDGEDEDTATYEYTFKLSHLIDKRAEIKRLTHQANLWAERTGDAIDGILTTSNAKVDRLSTSVSASNALFTYKISFRIDVQNFEKFQESFDTIFNTTGTSVQIKNGDLLIAVPLPKELIVPIDVGSMYREIFGNDEESAE